MRVRAGTRKASSNVTQPSKRRHNSMIDLNVFSLEGKTAIVAGASRGIGLAIAQHIARAGARTVLAARSVEALESNASDLRHQGYLAEAHEFDISDRESVNRLSSAYPET